MTVLLEDRAEIPAMAVIIGELRILEGGIQVGDFRQELDIRPFAARCRALGIAIVDRPDFGVAGILLLLRPHAGRIGFVVPHRVSHEGIHEDVRLVHVTDHALARRNRPRKYMVQRMAGLGVRNGRVDRVAGAVMSELRIGSGMERILIVRIDHVAAGTARIAIVARLVVGAEEPHGRVVQTSLCDVDHRNGDAVAGAAIAIAGMQVGPARLIHFLAFAAGIRIADIGELRADDAAAAFEYAEYIGRLDHFPRRQGGHRAQYAVMLHFRSRLDRVEDRAGMTVFCISLADDVVFERQDAVIIGRAAP